MTRINPSRVQTDPAPECAMSRTFRPPATLGGCATTQAKESQAGMSGEGARGMTTRPGVSPSVSVELRRARELYIKHGPPLNTDSRLSMSSVSGKSPSLLKSTSPQLGSLLHGPPLKTLR